jgi:hypothetical protein
MRKPQNTSHAVMAQRLEKRNKGLDDFPTPPWAVRALIEHVIGKDRIARQGCLEPACGRGYMASTLKEYFSDVQASDIVDYGFGQVTDFFEARCLMFNWVVTNPPFRLAEDFILRSLDIAVDGVAMLTRTVFLESVGRHKRLFQPFPPTIVAQFAERVPMVQGRLDGNASTATSYAWLVWDKRARGGTSFVWIPQCRKRLERAGDYEIQRSRVTRGGSGPDLIGPLWSCSNDKC